MAKDFPPGKKLPRNSHFTKEQMGRVTFLLEFFNAWLRHEDLHLVAAAVGKHHKILKRWIEDYPEFALAKEMADKLRVESNSFSGYVYKRLSKKSQEVWKQIQKADKEEGAYEKVENILKGHTKHIRQELFIHALISTTFDLGEALRMVNITRQCLERWKREDLEFNALCEEIQWHKGNFFETALFGLVEAGNPNAIIFANKTFNAGRGYSEKVQIEHSGGIENRDGFTFEDLDLDLETKKKVLDAIRRKKAEVAALSSGRKMLEADIVEA